LDSVAAPSRRAVVGLALFRGFLGFLLAMLPWLAGEGLDGCGLTQLGAGVAVIALALGAHRRPSLRWALAALALAVLFTPFAFDVRDMQIYGAVLIGKLLFITSFVSAQMFD
jgi:hypothetical protein